MNDKKYYKSVCTCNSVDSTDMIRDSHVEKDLYYCSNCGLIININLNQRCVSIYPNSNIIILEDLTMWELVKLHSYNYPIIKKLPGKSYIDFNKFYGDDGLANWWNPVVPFTTKDGIIFWNY